MISSEDVRHVTFDKAFQGYRREDVDDYLKQVAQAMDDLAAQNDDLQKKLVMLAQRIEKYRTMENSLSTSMINAQRMGDSIIRESKQKAAEIIRSANIKAEDREQRARDDVELAKQEIVTLKGEADSFKRSLIEMYRKHINLINKLPDYTRRPEDEPVPPPSPAPEQAAAPAAEPQPAVQAPVYTAPAAQPVQEPAPVQQAAQMPAMQETAYYEPPTAQPAPGTASASTAPTTRPMTMRRIRLVALYLAATAFNVFITFLLPYPDCAPIAHSFPIPLHGTSTIIRLADRKVKDFARFFCFSFQHIQTRAFFTVRI